MEFIADDKLNFKDIPKLPGCYIFKNRMSQVIYIGKSKSLQNRIRQHFKNTDQSDTKHIDMMKELRSFELIITASETDALICECKLIRAHKPKYNSQLKKERIFPFIRIDSNLQYPTITIVDSSANDGCNYYGSFYSKDDAMSAIELINSIWQTPLCCKNKFSSGHRPCLNFHLNKCIAPCGKEVDAGSYLHKVEEISKCLSGDFRSTFKRLRNDMLLASGEMDFERAAQIRDSISGLERLKKKQQKLYTDLDNKEVYLFLQAFGESCYSLFFIRNGVAMNRINFPNANELDLAVLSKFIDVNRNVITPLDDGCDLTGCLLSIGAHKQFIPVSRELNAQKTLNKIVKGFNSFID